MAEICAKFPIRVVLVWLALVAICYNLFSVHDPETAQIMYIPPSHLVDAVVFVAMGAMASDPMVDYSIASVRKLGKWNGEIYVVTDIPTCFTDAIQEYDIKTIQVPSAKSIIEIKSLKPRLITLMPPHVAGVLYIDVDILVTKNLAMFFRDLGTMIYTKQLEINHGKDVKKVDESKSKEGALDVVTSTDKKKGVAVTLEIDPPFDFAAFLDAKGHFVGFCSGCEKWHSGVSFNTALVTFCFVVLLTSFLSIFSGGVDATRQRRSLFAEMGRAAAVGTVQHRPGVLGCRGEGRRVPKFVRFPHAPLAVCEGLHCYAAHLRADFRAPHRRGPTGRHRLLLSGDHGASHTQLIAPAAEPQ